MGISDSSNHPSSTLEENMKKALTEMILLYFLSQKDCYIGELTEKVSKKSKGVLTVVFPYSAIYRLQQSEYIFEKEKRTAPDGRRRQYFAITEKGQEYLQLLLDTYFCFTQGIANIFHEPEQ